ncbi:hypothetical protein BH11PSE4_BH11PSE4_35450 [soil metagenome]
MTEEETAVALMYLKRMEEKLDCFSEEVVGAKVVLTNIEAIMGHVDLRCARFEQSIAGVNRRLDRVDERLDRIERRLDLVGTTH